MNLQELTQQELQSQWNKVCAAFENRKTSSEALPGILQLSRETDRRGLDLGKDRFGKIILEPKKEQLCKG